MNPIPPITHFRDILRPEFYRPVSGDHWLVMTDIRGSTAAIQAGRYKDVNTVGAAGIIAVLNACRRERIPFVFGGDGATLIVPNSWALATREALIGARRMAEESFGFDLRCGMVPISRILAEGESVEMARYQIRPGVEISAFRGGGLALAERWIKDPGTADQWNVRLDLQRKGRVDFSGLECRWQPISSRRGLIVSLIVQLSSRASLSECEGILGEIAATARWDEDATLIRRSQMRLAVLGATLLSESKVYQRGWRAGFRALFTGALSLLVGRIVFMLGPGRLPALGMRTDWGAYFESVLRQVDDRKYDGVIRTVIDTSAEGWSRLEASLLAHQEEGRLSYGAQVSRKMLMTCMVFDRELEHLHFVDGADGGYALAARQLKARLQGK